MITTSKFRLKVYISFIILVVILLLFSNLGQNFKTNLFSYTNIDWCSNKLTNNLLKSNSQEAYLNTTSDFIINYFKKYKVMPIKENHYSYNQILKIPVFNHTAFLEVKTPKGNIYKKYAYGKNFFEYFNGRIKAGSLIDKISIADNLNNNNIGNSRILLFNGYNNKNQIEIETIDRELYSKGVRAVIVPTLTSDLKFDSYMYDMRCKILKKGLIKIIVSKVVYSELKKLSLIDYSLNLSTSIDVKDVYAKNLYGLLKGTNENLKPLVIVSFYDGIYKTSDIKKQDFLKYSVPTAIALDSIKALNSQRLKAPERSIIFIFLSGYMNNIDVLNTIHRYSPNGNYLILDGLGRSNDVILTYNKSSKYLFNNTSKFLKLSDFNIISNNSFNNSIVNYVYLSQNYDSNFWLPKYDTITRSETFLLSLIGDECYGISFLSGNNKYFIVVKKFIRNYTSLIAFTTLILLLMVVYRSNRANK